MHCKAQPRRDGGRGHAVLARAGFRNNSRFPHAHDEQALPDAVINFVRAGVEQILALQVNARAAQMRGQPLGKLQRRGTPGEIAQ